MICPACNKHYVSKHNCRIRKCTTCKYTGDVYKHKCPTGLVEEALKIKTAQWVEDLTRSQCTICERFYPFHRLKPVSWDGRDHTICRYCLAHNFHIQGTLSALRAKLLRMTSKLKCIDCNGSGEDLYLEGKLFNVDEELNKFPSSSDIHDICHKLTTRCHPCRIQFEQGNRRTSVPLLTITCSNCGCERRKSAGCFVSAEGIMYCNHCAPPKEESSTTCSNCGHHSITCGDRMCSSCCSAQRFIGNRLCLKSDKLIHPTLAKAAKIQSRILMQIFKELT